MGYAASIEIFGKVEASAIEAIRAMAKAAVNEAVDGWTDPFTEEDFVEMIEAASSERKPLLLSGRFNESKIFAGDAEAAREAGLSYVVNYGDDEEDGYSWGFNWRPGMEEEFLFDTGRDDFSLSFEKIRELLDVGPDALRERMDLVEKSAKAGPIEVSAEFVEEYHGAAVGPVV